MKYFKYSEFDSPDLLGSGYKMDANFLNRLDLARAIAGIPFKINSGYRTIAHNNKTKGSMFSSHLTGHAADIHCSSSTDRKKIVSALLKAGFNRIGIARTFIHVDNDATKSKDVIWLY